MSQSNLPPGPNNGMPQNGSGGWPTNTHPTGAPQQFPDNWPENSSRRKFLKAALVGTAAAAAGGAATYVGISRIGSAPVSNFKFIGQSGSPGGQTASACTTGTDPKNYTPQTSFNNSEAIFLWGLFTNLPAGNYTLGVSPAIENKGHAVCTPSPAPNPFEYVGSTSASSNAQLYDIPADNVTWNCSPAKQSDLPTATRTGGSLAKLFSSPYSSTINVAAGHDLQLQLHIKNGCSGARSVIVTISLSGPVNLSAQATISIKA